MAFSALGWGVLIFSGVSLLLLVIFFIGRMLGVDIFGALSQLVSKKESTLVKTSTIPEEEIFKIIYPKYNFAHTIKGVVEAGKDERTGKALLRFRYGNNQITSWCIQKDAVYFRPNLDKLFSGKKPYEFLIIDDDEITKMRQEIDRLNLYVAAQNSRINTLVESEKIRMQKMLEYQRNARNIAFGWSGVAPQSQIFTYRPWAPYRNVVPAAPEYEEGIV